MTSKTIFALIVSILINVSYVFAADGSLYKTLSQLDFDKRLERETQAEAPHNTEKNSPKTLATRHKMVVSRTSPKLSKDDAVITVPKHTVFTISEETGDK